MLSLWSWQCFYPPPPPAYSHIFINHVNMLFTVAVVQSKTTWSLLNSMLYNELIMWYSLNKNLRLLRLLNASRLEAFFAVYPTGSCSGQTKGYWTPRRMEINSRSMIAYARVLFFINTSQLAPQLSQHYVVLYRSSKYIRVSNYIDLVSNYKIIIFLIFIIIIAWCHIT